jgi:hypothetical protein
MAHSTLDRRVSIRFRPPYVLSANSITGGTDVGLRTEVIDVSDCDPTLASALFALYAEYYAPALREVFDADLARKNWVILLYDDADTVVGFSTIADQRLSLGGQSVRALFSGDTIIDRAHWGSWALPYCWLRLAGRLWSEDPSVPLYWLLISKGHRTYRLMPAFAEQHFPAPGIDIPTDVRKLMDRLGHEMFGAQYVAGTVHPTHPSRLRPEHDGLERGDRANRHIRFFLQRNPGYAAGEEMLCLCVLHPDNLRPRARAQFLAGAAR